MVESITETKEVLGIVTFERCHEKLASSIGYMAGKYKVPHVVGMSYEDLIQEGNIKLWEAYTYHREATPAMELGEFCAIVRTALANMCKDLQRSNFFSEKRNVNMVVDIESAYQNAGVSVPVTALDLFEDTSILDPRQAAHMESLLSKISSRLSNLGRLVLKELVDPSEELLSVMRSEVALHEDTNLRRDLDKRLDTKIYTMIQPNDTIRVRFPRMTGWHLSVALDTPYDETCGAFNEVKTIIADYVTC